MLMQHKPRYRTLLKRAKRPPSGRGREALHEEKDQSDGGHGPGSERDPHEDRWNHVQKRQAKFSAHSLSANGIHPEREDSCPISVVVAEWVVLSQVTPKAQGKQHRNPPGRR